MDKHIKTSSRYKIIDGKVHFAWSFHKSADRANFALEDAYASDQISEGERPQIAANGNGWSIFLPMEG